MDATAGARGGDRIRDARRDGGGVRRGDERLRPTSLFVFEFRLGEFRPFVFRGGGFLPRAFLRLGGGGDARVHRRRDGARRLAPLDPRRRASSSTSRGSRRRATRRPRVRPPSTARNSEAFSAAAAAHPASRRSEGSIPELSDSNRRTGTAGTGTAGTGTARAAFARTAFARTASTAVGFGSEVVSVGGVVGEFGVGRGAVVGSGEMGRIVVVGGGADLEVGAAGGDRARGEADDDAAAGGMGGDDARCEGVRARARGARAREGSPRTRGGRDETTIRRTSRARGRGRRRDGAHGARRTGGETRTSGARTRGGVRTRRGRRARRWCAASCADGARAFRLQIMVRNRGDEHRAGSTRIPRAQGVSIAQPPRVGRIDQSRTRKIFDVEWHDTQLASLEYLRNTGSAAFQQFASTRSALTQLLACPPPRRAFRLRSDDDGDRERARPTHLGPAVHLGADRPDGLSAGHGQGTCSSPRSRPENSPFGTCVRSPSHPPRDPRPLARSPRPDDPRPPASRA